MQIGVFVLESKILGKYLEKHQILYVHPCSFPNKIDHKSRSRSLKSELVHGITVNFVIPG